MDKTYLDTLAVDFVLGVEADRGEMLSEQICFRLAALAIALLPIPVSANCHAVKSKTNCSYHTILSSVVTRGVSSAMSDSRLTRGMDKRSCCTSYFNVNVTSLSAERFNGTSQSSILMRCVPYA